MIYCLDQPLVGRFTGGSQFLVGPVFDLPIRGDTVAVTGAAKMTDDGGARGIPVSIDRPMIASHALAARRGDAGGVGY